MKLGPDKDWIDLAGWKQMVAAELRRQNGEDEDVEMVENTGN